MTRRALLIILAMLAGCAGSPPVDIRVQEVVKPVAVYPVKPEQVPTPPAALPPRPASPSAAADILLAKVCEMVAYVIKAAPLLGAATGGVAVPAPRYPECEGKGNSGGD